MQKSQMQIKREEVRAELKEGKPRATPREGSRQEFEKVTFFSFLPFFF